MKTVISHHDVAVKSQIQSKLNDILLMHNITFTYNDFVSLPPLAVKLLMEASPVSVWREDIVAFDATYTADSCDCD